ncbi:MULTISPECIES: helix-turn-helix transcriptional regulator [unclassified Streptomyces]|uniref:helix-turn-helix transcriptional regulator n=1 Tax=unclassified Streptomyces TaxID=2593676 RepID=UPI0035DE6346
MSTTARPLLTQREAASACGVSRSTIRRRREAGELPGCVQDEERGWLIPVEALLAAGFRLHAPSPPEDAVPAGSAVPAAGPAAAGAVGEDVAALRAELERERQAHALEVAEARHQAALAAAEAGHLRTQLAAKEDHIEDLRTALRALAPAPERAAIEQNGHQGDGAGVVVPGQAAPERTVPTGAEAGREPGPESRRRWWGGRR